MKKGDFPSDPRGLIYEAYRIDGIVPAECRSIFMDWALGVPDDEDTLNHVQILLTHYGPSNTDHPMTEVLREGVSRKAIPRRRRKG